MNSVYISIDTIDIRMSIISMIYPIVCMTGTGTVFPSSIGVSADSPARHGATAGAEGS